jgi:hypothetical protein
LLAGQVTFGTAHRRSIAGVVLTGTPAEFGKLIVDEREKGEILRRHDEVTVSCGGDL